MTAIVSELESVTQKDPNMVLVDYGYDEQRITELEFRDSFVPKPQDAPNESVVRNFRRSPRNTRLVLPTDLERLSYDEVEQVLDDERYTKRQIAELGFRRFGIPEKSILRARKDDAVMSVRAAVTNERILDAIAEQARKAGMMRSV